MNSKNKSQKKQPIIIIGVPRSGTTMLTRHMEQLGLFMGKRVDINSEAIFFQKLNNWVFQQCGLRWDFPDRFNEIFKLNDLKQDVLKTLYNNLSSSRSSQYLGVKNYFRYGSIINIPFTWGWKDPRNTFTLGLWKEIFPSAKVIHIYRNPIDVAVSMRNMELKFRSLHKANLKNNLKKLLLLGNLGYIQSMGTTELSTGIDLWKKYITQALLMEKEFNADFLTLKYEDYLNQPIHLLAKIADFSGLNYSKDSIHRAVLSVNKSRKYAFLQDKELIELYNSIKDEALVKQLGYNCLT